MLPVPTSPDRNPLLSEETSVEKAAPMEEKEAFKLVANAGLIAEDVTRYTTPYFPGLSLTYETDRRYGFALECLRLSAITLASVIGAVLSAYPLYQLGGSYTEALALYSGFSDKSANWAKIISANVNFGVNIAINTVSLFLTFVTIPTLSKLKVVPLLLLGLLSAAYNFSAVATAFDDSDTPKNTFPGLLTYQLVSIVANTAISMRGVLKLEEKYKSLRGDPDRRLKLHGLLMALFDGCHRALSTSHPLYRELRRHRAALGYRVHGLPKHESRTDDESSSQTAPITANSNPFLLPPLARGQRIESGQSAVDDNLQTSSNVPTQQQRNRWFFVTSMLGTLPYAVVIGLSTLKHRIALVPTELTYIFAASSGIFKAIFLTNANFTFLSRFYNFFFLQQIITFNTLSRRATALLATFAGALAFLSLTSSAALNNDYLPTFDGELSVSHIIVSMLTAFTAAFSANVSDVYFILKTATVTLTRAYDTFFANKDIHCSAYTYTTELNVPAPAPDASELSPSLRFDVEKQEQETCPLPYDPTALQKNIDNAVLALVLMLIDTPTSALMSAFVTDARVTAKASSSALGQQAYSPTERYTQLSRAVHALVTLKERQAQVNYSPPSPNSPSFHADMQDDTANFVIAYADTDNEDDFIPQTLLPASL